MVWSWLLAVSLGSRTVSGDPSPTVQVSVDSARHELTVIAGPYDLPNMPATDDHAMMDLGTSHDTRLQRFEWPVDGWFRGFRLELTDGSGRPVPPEVMHHMIVVNFSRRQLLYSAAERLMGTGTETEEVTVPKTIGVPMKPGMDLGMYIAWHNTSGHDLQGVRLKLVMLWTPKNQNPPPVNALPLYMDVNLTVGGTNTYDLPPGRSSKAYEFTLPTGGRLLAIGGHMHDYGTRVKLQDAKSGKVLTEVVATRAPDGKLVKVSRKLFGVRGSGLRLKTNRRYRILAEYDNPTGETRLKGAMASMVGLFVPDDLKRWPSVDPGDPTYRRDLASLVVKGGKRGMSHEHGRAGHEVSD